MSPKKCVQEIRIGEKCIPGDDGNLSVDDASKERLLNVEFPWSRNLPHIDSVAGPAQFILIIQY